MSRAVRIERFGGVEVLEVREVDRPGPDVGRVVVEVVATAVNPGEIVIREGVADGHDEGALPMGEGSDLAGRVAAVGEGVDAWRPGDEVIGWSDERAAHADFVSVPAEQLVARPPDVPWDQAGSLYVAGCTAWAMVEAAAPEEGETVMVAGAAGGVGSIAVQLLTARGARVLGVASAANDEWLTSKGVIPVNYGDDLEERVGTAAPDGVAAVLDTYGGGYVDLARTLGVPTARIVTIIDFEAAERGEASVVYGHAVASAEVMAALAGLVESGDLEVPIAATYPLEEVRDAYRRLADRHTRGKLVLCPAGTTPA